VFASQLRRLAGSARHRALINRFLASVLAASGVCMALN